MSDGKITAAAAKPDLSLLPIRSRVGVARIRAYGVKKYALGNYLQATLADGAGARYVAAMLRHLQAMQAPGGAVTAESLAARDEESGLPHIDHMMCGLEMLREILIQEGVLPEDPGVGNEPPSKKQMELFADGTMDSAPRRQAFVPKFALVEYHDSEDYEERDVSWFTTKAGAFQYVDALNHGEASFVPTSRDPDSFWGVLKL